MLHTVIHVLELKNLGVVMYGIKSREVIPLSHSELSPVHKVCIEDAKKGFIVPMGKPSGKVQPTRR